MIFAFYKELLLLTFDPTLALVLRLPALRYMLLVLIALTIVVSLQTVGIALMLAMLVMPAAAAQLLTRSPAGDDGHGGGVGRLLERGGALPLVLRQPGLGAGDGARLYLPFSAWFSSSRRSVVFSGAGSARPRRRPCPADSTFSIPPLHT